MSTAERDRSVWTDTPAERERKQRAQERDDAAANAAPSRPLPPVHSRYDDDIRRNVQQYNVGYYYKGFSFFLY